MRKGYTYEELVIIAAESSHRVFIRHRKQAAREEHKPEPQLDQSVHPHDIDRGKDVVDEFIRIGMFIKGADNLYYPPLPDTP